MNGASAGSRDVAVLGAGPAGVAAAVGLARLGHAVRLYAGAARRGIEGASERLLQLLERLELHEAAATMQVRGPRSRQWAGLSSVNGTEYLIDRAQFDQALRRDATRAGATLEPGWVRRCEARDGAWSIHQAGDAGHETFCAVVDARGRKVRGFSQRGPSLLALTQRFSTPPGAEPGTAIVMGDDRWCWVAQDGRGNLDVQVVCAPLHAGSRPALRALLTDGSRLPSSVAARLESATPVGELRARAAGAFLRRAAQDAGRVLAGDAAMALDPLSGHGIYEALASADATVAAINTHLQGGDWNTVQRFMHERAQELWARKAVAAGSFYEQAAGSNSGDFWSTMSRGYAELAARAGMLHDPVTRIQSRPVLNGTRIEMRRVLVAPQWPRGLWRYGDIEIAELLDCCSLGERDAGRAAAQLRRPEAAVRAAMQWLSVQGALPAGGASGFRRAEPVGAPMARSST